MTSNRPKTAKPPIKCIPCRVTYDGNRFHVCSNGKVYFCYREKLVDGSYIDLDGSECSETLSKAVRREASRLRRNRNARERNQAMRDLGMVKTSYGWE